MRKRFCGYDKDGIPLWLDHYLWWYSERAEYQTRVLRRLRRMVKVELALRRRALQARLQPGPET